MITFSRTLSTVTMDLVDLEDCGFDHMEYREGLRLAGLSETDWQQAIWPEYLIVRFRGGAVVVGKPPVEED